MLGSRLAAIKLVVAAALPEPEYMVLDYDIEVPAS
jgi:hypothetical protein